MSRIKEVYWDLITAPDTVEDLDYQYQRYIKALKDEENLLYYNTDKNESIRKDAI